MNPDPLSQLAKREIGQVGMLLGVGVLLFLGLVGFRADTLPFAPNAPFSDATISRYPDALHFQRSLREHHTLPVWNPHLMGGQPFAANPGTKTFYPLTWLLVVLPVTLHLNLMLAGHLWWGALGLWAWSRRTGLKGGAALLAAVGYLFAPKLLAHAGAGHLDLLIALAWLPWLLVALHVNFTPSPQAERGIIFLAFVLAMLFVGAIQLLPYTYGLGMLYAGSLLWQAPKKLGQLGLAGFLAGGMAAAQWVPLWELRESLSRGNIRLEDAALASLQPGQLIGLLIGNHGGGQEQLTYVGISVLLLAGLGLLAQPRRHWLWWGVVLVAVFYALGENFILWRGLVEIFPPLLWFRVPSRAWFVVALLLPYLAGWGVQGLLEMPSQSARARLAIVGLVGMGLTCAVASQAMLQETEIKKTALWGLFFLPLTAFLIALVIFQRLEPRYMLPAFIVLVAADCLWIDRTLIEGRPESAWLDKTPPALLADLAQTGGRIYTPDYAIPQQDTAYWGIARFDGVDPFQIGTFINAADRGTGVPRAGYSTTVPAVVVLEDDETSLVYKNAPLNAALLGQWGVEWVIVGYPIEAEGLELVAQEDALFFYRNTLGWGDKVQLKWQTPNRVEQVITGEALDLKTVTYAPGWQGISTQQASLPARNAVFEYQPIGVYVGMAISAMSYLLAGVCLLRKAWRA